MFKKIVVLIIVLLLNGCGFKNKSNISVVDTEGNVVEEVFVLPLYSYSKGIYHADGSILSSDVKYTIGPPYIFHSMDDIFEHGEHGNALMIPFPPYAVLGSVVTVNSLLILKKNFVPNYIDYIDIFKKKIVVLDRSVDNIENVELVSLVLSKYFTRENVELFFGKTIPDDPSVCIDYNEVELLRSALLD